MGGKANKVYKDVIGGFPITFSLVARLRRRYQTKSGYKKMRQKQSPINVVYLT